MALVGKNLFPLLTMGFVCYSGFLQKIVMVWRPPICRVLRGKNPGPNPFRFQNQALSLGNSTLGAFLEPKIAEWSLLLSKNTIWMISVYLNSTEIILSLWNPESASSRPLVNPKRKMIPDTVLLQRIKLFQETSTVSICKSKVDSAEGIYRNPYVNNCLRSNIQLMNCIDSVSLILRLPKTNSTWKKSCTIKRKMFIPWERTLNSTTMHLHRSFTGSMGEYVGSKC